MIRGWGSFWQVQLPKGPCATYVGGRWCVRQHMGLLCCAPAYLTVLQPKEMLLRAGIAESAFKFFAEDTNNHGKLQECDFFPSLLSLRYDVLWWTFWGRSVESPWIEASALKISKLQVGLCSLSFGKKNCTILFADFTARIFLNYFIHYASSLQSVFISQVNNIWDVSIRSSEDDTFITHTAVFSHLRRNIMLHISAHPQLYHINKKRRLCGKKKQRLKRKLSCLTAHCCTLWEAGNLLSLAVRSCSFEINSFSGNTALLTVSCDWKWNVWSTRWRNSLGREHLWELCCIPWLGGFLHQEEGVKDFAA